MLTLKVWCDILFINSDREEFVMNKTKIFADFNDITGNIKPMHCGNIGPRQKGATLVYDFTEEFKEMGIPYTRLHDVEYPYGANQFVDIHCIFPDFDADVESSDSYNFEPTDKYLEGIINAGGEVFYRLGESIDHFPKPLYLDPPKDYLKWAKICEHIIMHYNEGWANGFNMGIKYWEIWNEPDNDHMWLGTPEEFYELYRVTAIYLKERFGDSIKIGGYASSGFYMLNRENAGDWFKTLVPYMHGFFKYITAEETKAPMDFFSWHCYADTPEEVRLHSEYAKNMLEQYNIKNCESILDEFNMYYCFGEYAPLHRGIFTDVAASMILGQKSPLDMLMYYDFEETKVYNCAFAVTGISHKDIVRLAGFEAFSDFNKLYRLGNEVKTAGDIEEKLYILGAKSETQGALMIVSRGFEGELDIEIAGDYTSYSIKLTDDNNEDRTPNISKTDDLLISNGTININIGKNEILLLLLN